MTVQVPNPAGVPAASAPDTTPTLIDFDRVVEASARSEGVPGLSAARLVDGQWQVSHYGVDNPADGRVRDGSSRQHGTCLNKVLIAYVALMLVERGLLSLDQPLKSTVPEAVKRRDGGEVHITLRQVLSHSSGIDESFEEWNPESAIHGERLRRFDRYPQIADPGEVFFYSDASTAIAALAIERALGKPWKHSVNELLLGPLGIKPLPETTDVTAYYEGVVAVGHTWDDATQSLQPVVPTDASTVVDTLAERSTCFNIDELCTLAEFALADGVTREGQRLLSVELAHEMRRKQVDVPGHHLIHSWGLGWMFFDEKSFGFESAGEGHENFVQIFPEERRALVVMANVYPAQAVYYDILRTLRDEPPAHLDDGYKKRPVDLAACVGTYRSDGYKLEISRGSKYLRFELLGRVAEHEWRPVQKGDLIPSVSGGFTARSGRKMGRRASVTPIWTSRKSERPDFFRFGQKVVRRDA